MGALLHETVQGIVIKLYNLIACLKVSEVLNKV